MFSWLESRLVSALLNTVTMEKMPYQDHSQVDRESIPFAWHFGLPTIRGEKAGMRGNSFCFAIVPEGYEDAMGLFQVRQLEPGFGSAEWGFAIGSPFWGRGMFVEGAKAVIDFSFGVVGMQRLEARSIASNGRGNAALRKVGAYQESTLRRSFQRNGRYFDQILWSILKDDWRQTKAVWGPRLH